MTIEILNPELERLVNQEIRSGHFQNIDDLLTEAIQALREKSGSRGELSAPETPAPPMTRGEAGAHLRAARRGNRLPEGMTIRDVINQGRA